MYTYVYIYIYVCVYMYMYVYVYLHAWMGTLVILVMPSGRPSDAGLLAGFEMPERIRDDLGLVTISIGLHIKKTIPTLGPRA